MADIGNGYGSECHLLRYLGRHRQKLDAAVKQAMRVDSPIEWLDFPFDEARSWKDGEWKGLEFLADRPDVQRVWREFWPQGAGIHNWDAVGWCSTASGRDLLLVEAKANVEEILSSCGAKEFGGLHQIREALDKTKRAIGSPESCNWLEGYYQLANRLAVIYFLGSLGIRVHLLLIYFVGDAVPGRTCPRSRAEWQPALDAQDRHLGIAGPHAISDRVHKVFLPVSGATGVAGPGNRTGGVCAPTMSRKG